VAEPRDCGGEGRMVKAIDVEVGIVYDYWSVIFAIVWR
jgi:hypothetical protein